MSLVNTGSQAEESSAMFITVALYILAFGFVTHDLCLA